MNSTLHSKIQFASFAPITSANPLNPSDCVYVVLVMLHDEYAVGAAVLAQSLRSTGTKVPIWCLVASEPSERPETAAPGISGDAKDFLLEYFDYIVEVPLIQHDHVVMPGKNQNKAYVKWARYGFTKTHILDPQILPFKKALLIDADAFVRENIDHLFNLQTPACTFSSPWLSPYVEAAHRKDYVGMRNIVVNHYGEIDHGSEVTSDQIRRSLRNSKVGSGNLILVSPSADYVAVRDAILSAGGKFGSPGCYSGPDEQLFAEVFLRCETNGIAAYHIHQVYNWCVGKSTWLPADTQPRGVVQYYNDNRSGQPWRKTLGDEHVFSDSYIWWYFAKSIISEWNHSFFYRSTPLARYFAGDEKCKSIAEKGRKHERELAGLTVEVMGIDLVKDGVTWINKGRLAKNPPPLKSSEENWRKHKS